MGIILSIAGALRREELYKMRVEDIEDRDRLIIVKVPLTKTYIQRSFVVITEANEKVQYLNIYNKYKNLPPKNIFPFLHKLSQWEMYKSSYWIRYNWNLAM